jgi:hypothetical protein
MSDESDSSELDPAAEPNPADSRREFIRRMTYLAPVVTTYLLAETAYGKDEEEEEKDRGRRRRRISPKPRGSTPPPPSPAPP